MFCYGSFANAQGVCEVPITKVGHCLQYFANGICQYCQLDYYLTADGKCEEIKIDDCDVVSPTNPNYCIECEDGEVAVDGKCEAGVDCDIDNCSSCILVNNIKRCTRCKSRYALMNMGGDMTVCREEANKQENCFFLNSQGICSVCDINYYMTATGKCERSPVLDLELSSQILNFLALLNFILFF